MIYTHAQLRFLKEVINAFLASVFGEAFFHDYDKAHLLIYGSAGLVSWPAVWLAQFDFENKNMHYLYVHKC